MKEVIRSGKFKKDIKRYLNQPKKLDKLADIVFKLANDEPLPASARPHMLAGNYVGYMECHIEGDLLLIWLDKDSNTIVLTRMGSHSELF